MLIKHDVGTKDCAGVDQRRLEIEIKSSVSIIISSWSGLTSRLDFFLWRTCKHVENVQRSSIMTAVTPPVDLSHFYSYTASNRKPSSVKEFYKYFLIPGIANFAGGTTLPIPIGNNQLIGYLFRFTTPLILPL